MNVQKKKKVRISSHYDFFAFCVLTLKYFPERCLAPTETRTEYDVCWAVHHCDN